MNFVRISRSQPVNLDSVTRIEIYEGESYGHTTLHFTDGETYRCTEEEAQALLPYVERRIEDK